jgi:hypothetical protein
MTPSLQKGSREFKYLIKVMKQAHELQVRNWTISWQLPRISTQCTNATFCVNTTTTAIKDEYKQHNKELYDLFNDVFARLVKFRGGRATRSDLKLNKHARKLYNENLNRSNSIPDSQSVCN